MCNVSWEFSAQKMLYELMDGKLKKIEYAEGKHRISNIKDTKYVTNLNDENSVIIDSVQNRCFIASNDLINNGFSKTAYEQIMGNMLMEQDEKKSSNNITFILAITYSCNLHCTYCYQQHDTMLDKKLISQESLDEVLKIIEEYMKLHPEKQVDLGLFGGEPLLISNEKIIDQVIEFCKKKKIQVHITTNGFFLEYYLKKLIINRKFISSINPTIDSVKLNYLTRNSIDISKNTEDETQKLIKCIKTLLYYGIHVNVATNIDKHNYMNIWNIRNDLEKLQLLTDKNFTWSIGRVDDRLYETDFPDIIMESEIIPQLQREKIPSNMHAAFMKTSYNLVEKMGLKLHQYELKGKLNYCWNSSDLDVVFYVDSNLKTYRCTYTVGRPQYSIFDFSLENLERYKIPVKTYLSYKECANCTIGGYCGGGCQLSHGVNFDKCCDYEKRTFDYFMQCTFLPFLRELYCEQSGDMSS